MGGDAHAGSVTKQSPHGHLGFGGGIGAPARPTAPRYNQEPFYMNTADYLAFAKTTLVEQKAPIEKLGLAR
jgi:hypothetical protein